MSETPPKHHYYAIVTIALASVLDTAFGVVYGISDHIGVWNGLYFATVTATTVGYGDIIPSGWLPHVLAVGIMLTVIPLFAATFSLFTSSLTSLHVHRAKDELKRHFDKSKESQNGSVSESCSGDSFG